MTNNEFTDQGLGGGPVTASATLRSGRPSRPGCDLALGFGQMRGRRVPVCHCGQTFFQMGLMNIEIALNTWRESKQAPESAGRLTKGDVDLRPTEQAKNIIHKQYTNN